jgi:hypothetical protein
VPQRGQWLASIATELFPNQAPNSDCARSGVTLPSLTASRFALRFTLPQSGRRTGEIDPKQPVGPARSRRLVCRSSHTSGCNGRRTCVGCTTFMARRLGAGGRDGQRRSRAVG